MKRILVVACSLLLVFTLVSCGNITLTVRNGKTNEKGAVSSPEKGKLIIKVPLPAESRDAGGAGQTVLFPGQEDVDYYMINMRKSNDPEWYYEDLDLASITPEQMDEGVELVVEPDTYEIEINAYKVINTPGTPDQVLFRGLIADAWNGTGYTVDITAGSNTVTLEMRRLIATLINGMYSYSIYRASNNLDTEYTPPYVLTGLPEFTVSGKVIGAWKDRTNTDENGDLCEYEPGEPINLAGKTLPLNLDVQFVDSAITYSFDSGFASPGQTGLEDGTMYEEIVMPVYNQTMSLDGTIRGLFTDTSYEKTKTAVTDMMWSHDERWYREEDGTYIFCGWAVNKEIPLLENNTYNDNLELIKNTKIVQPGEKYILKGNTTFHAVWLNSRIKSKVMDFHYIWCDGRPDYNAQYYLNYLIDNVRTDNGDSYTTYEARFKLPEIATLFPQWNDLPTEYKQNKWTYTADFSAGTECVYKTTYSDRVVQYMIDFPNYGDGFAAVKLIWDITDIYMCEKTFPLPEKITITSAESLKESYFVPTGSYFDNWKLQGSTTTYADSAEITLSEDQRYLRSGLPVTLEAQWSDTPTGFVLLNGSIVMQSPDNEQSKGSFYSNKLPVSIDSFYMAETETTWERWYEVYSWATDSERGDSIYEFKSTGSPGGKTENGSYSAIEYAPDDPVTETNRKQPVSTISFYDAIVWCNAASEKDGFQPVYYYGNAVIRNSVDNSAKNAEPKEDANGYRLPTLAEWEYAARGGDPTDSTNWNYVYAGSNTASAVAVYDTDKTADVKSKGEDSCNSAGLYDMSGNVWEYTWVDIAYDVLKGGGFNSDASYSAISYYIETARGASIGNKGFRVVRSIPPSTPLRVAMVSINGATVSAPVMNSESAFYTIDAENTSTYITVSPYKIGETEITYEDWYEVRVWGLSHGYTFSNKGSPSTDSTLHGTTPTEDYKDKPVISISWQNAVVWCNAASERAGLTPVYYMPGSEYFTSDNVIRSIGSATVGSGNPENAIVNPNAEGYRLPTKQEWEFAARGADPSDSTNWNYTYAGSDVASDVAVYDQLQPANVKTKAPNKANLYDMTGNAWEFIWDLKTATEYQLLGGGYNSNSETQLYLMYPRSGYINGIVTYAGFRVAQTRF